MQAVLPHIHLRGVTLEDEVFVGHGVIFINDRYPKSTSGCKLQIETDWKVTPTLVKRGSSIGSGAVIMCGVTIGQSAMFASRRPRATFPTTPSLSVFQRRWWETSASRRRFDERRWRDGLWILGT